MKLDDLNKWLNLTANLGVIAGIIFVAIEVNQNTVQTQLQTSNDFLNSFTQVELSMATNNDLLAAILSSQKGEEVSEIDQVRLLVIYRSIVRGYQNSYYQSKTGLLNPQVWEGERNEIKQSFGFDAGLRRYWADNKSLYTPEFNEMIEDLILQQ